MCWIVAQPTGDSPVTLEHIAMAWSGNKDGAGYCFIADGKLIIRKPFYKLGKLQRNYAIDHAKYGATSPFIMHLRYSTHGSKGKHNVHPHVLDDGNAALAHNGILSDFAGDYGDKYSDTVRFCWFVLSARPYAQLTSPEFGELLEGMIGSGNKLAIMDVAGNVSIINADEGVWDGGRWYSNNAHEKAPVRGYRIGSSKAVKYEGKCEGGAAFATGQCAHAWDGYDDDVWKEAKAQEEWENTTCSIDNRVTLADGTPIAHTLDTDAIHDAIDRQALEAAERDTAGEGFLPWHYRKGN